MGTAYSARQSSYTQGDTINADDTNDEFDAILAAFGTSGHTHDGTAGEGGAIAGLLNHTITFGAGTAGTDITITFDGESNDDNFNMHVNMLDEAPWRYSEDGKAIEFLDNHDLKVLKIFVKELIYNIFTIVYSII